MNKSLIASKANPHCPDCFGEGICCYAIGDDGYDDLCETCFPGGSIEPDDTAYDEWKDAQCEVEKK